MHYIHIPIQQNKWLVHKIVVKGRLSASGINIRLSLIGIGGKYKLNPEC